MTDIKQLREKFQKKLGQSPKVEIGYFENWAGLRKIKNLLSVTPENLDEVKNVVTSARDLGVSLCLKRYITIPV